MKIFGREHHNCENPWEGAPLWAIELGAQNILIISTLEAIMAAIDDLQAAVAAEDTVIDSAVTLLNGIPALIAAAGVDPAKLTALQADITSRTATLAAAVLVGTPTPAPAAPPVTAPAAAAAATAAVATP
jgi:hypothetical protein